MRVLLAWAVTLTTAFGFLACSSESSNPEPPTTFKVDSGTDTGADTGLVTDSLLGETSAPDTAGCVGEAGCFSCKPTTTEQFLNRCSGAQCSKFDDKTRIPSSVWDGGALPAVP